MFLYKNFILAHNIVQFKTRDVKLRTDIEKTRMTTSINSEALLIHTKGM